MKPFTRRPRNQRKFNRGWLGLLRSAQTTDAERAAEHAMREKLSDTEKSGRKGGMEPSDLS